MFDFDLTLVAEASQVIILMIILDKIVFTPVGETIDKRDEEIKRKLANVKDNSSEVEEIYVRFFSFFFFFFSSSLLSYAICPQHFPFLVPLGSRSGRGRR